ncbi:MAG: class I mannose-6-phosphate isomerase [Sphingomonadales bacterium]|nr:class I mannose-6-phosphate isomerase [Sphingomonadales bacterium]
MSAALPARMVDKPWGCDRLPPPFTAPQGRRIGEIWFEPPAALAGLLVKYLFTSEALSVQVHPNDAQTLAKGLGRQGKEECWLVIAAEPGARIGIGFAAAIDAQTMRAAARDGSIEARMRWHAVEAGDFFYIPANTVHAIGAGVSLIEIQQHSDITYRLYDYGRPRALHLDEAVAVACGEPYSDPRRRRLGADEAAQLVDGPSFRLDRIAGPPAAALRPAYGARPLLVIPLAGPIGIGGEHIAPGGCALADTIDAVDFGESRLALLAQPC